MDADAIRYRQTIEYINQFSYLLYLQFATRRVGRHRQRVRLVGSKNGTNTTFYRVKAISAVFQWSRTPRYVDLLDAPYVRAEVAHR